MPVTFPEATLGTTITVPTLDGKVTLKVPPGTQSGRCCACGSGRARASAARPPGDLLVTIEVVVPTELTDEQRAAVESLAEVTKPAPRVAVDG